MVDSPVGRLTLVATDEGLAAILWENDRPRRVRLNIEAEDTGHPVLVETERQLGEYFAGQRKEFALKLDLAGTAFQRKVWNALLTIPFGETRSYGQIATQIGSTRLPCARSARPTAGIPSRSSRRAIGSSDPRASSRGSPAGSTSRRICWRWKEPRRYRSAPACYASTSEAAFDRVRARLPPHTPHWRLDSPGSQRNHVAMKETARMDKEHDFVVIGTGPGGEGAAMQAAKQGKSVAVGRADAADRRRLHALGHDSQQGAAVRDLSDDRSEQQPAVPRGRPRG